MTISSFWKTNINAIFYLDCKLKLTMLISHSDNGFHTYLYFWKKFRGSKSFAQSDLPWRMSFVTPRPTIKVENLITILFKTSRACYKLSKIKVLNSNWQIKKQELPWHNMGLLWQFIVKLVPYCIQQGYFPETYST